MTTLELAALIVVTILAFAAVLFGVEKGIKAGRRSVCNELEHDWHRPPRAAKTTCRRCGVTYEPSTWPR